MHFHVVEIMHGDHPRDLGGDLALTYPSVRPVFVDRDRAVAAIAASAFDHWGTPAEAHVEVTLALELARADELEAVDGATTSWSEPTGEGAQWVLNPCRCADGTVAQVIAGW